jgi:hypothetical protein
MSRAVEPSYIPGHEIVLLVYLIHKKMQATSRKQGEHKLDMTATTNRAPWEANIASGASV